MLDQWKDKILVFGIFARYYNMAYSFTLESPAHIIVALPDYFDNIHLRFWYILRCIIEVSYICTKIREFCRRLRTMLQREQIKTWITRDQGVWGNMLQKRKSCINVCYSSKTNNKLPVTLSPRYCPFHKTLPRSSAFVSWISVRFYETDCK